MVGIIYNMKNKEIYPRCESERRGWAESIKDLAPMFFTMAVNSVVMKIALNQMGKEGVIK
jgi:hypothetical protein